MALEWRGNKRYYYGKMKEGKKVVSAYIGQEGTPFADMVREELLQRARQRQEAARAQKEQKNRIQQQYRQSAEMLLYAKAIIIAGGEWKYRYRIWRKKTMRKKTGQSPLPARPERGDYSNEALKALTKRCSATDADNEDILLLRELLATVKVSIVEGIELALGGLQKKQSTPAHTEAVRAWVAHKRATYGYVSANAFIKPLIDHLIVCEFRLGEDEYALSIRQDTPGTQLTHIEYEQRAVERSQRRYHAALAALIRVTSVRMEWVEGSDGTNTLAIEASPHSLP